MKRLVISALVFVIMLGVVAFPAAATVKRYQISDAEEVLGIGVDEATSVVVNYNGYAEVIGEGAAYFVLGDHRPEECEPGIPLTFSNYKMSTTAHRIIDYGVGLKEPVDQTASFFY